MKRFQTYLGAHLSDSYLITAHLVRDCSCFARTLVLASHHFQCQFTAQQSYFAHFHCKQTKELIVLTTNSLAD